MGVRACCLSDDNLVTHATDKPDLIVRVCSVCGARHFELTIDPGHIGVVLK